MQPITIVVLTVLCSVSWACVDLTNPNTGTSDCPARVSLCNNSIYLPLMRTQCPKTCGFCSSSSTVTSVTTTTVSSTCVDRTNAATGTSDCTRLRAYCTNTIYIPLMRVQCPRTCGFCTSG
ncbi:hypothetical protein GCK72_006340 [Caenorhabditis remanei]|uniref:ShKT domain-containing protein n=1 Tax=Caenorhabditis remanei TaxID=31234 RepID=A0A6A5HJ27_CAERE|nr:hypothetical protein GCK72_006340 [Caenorhabditis remanei]KAF1766383.1 hypothetical protein GCK72_006340 [Caenorhabditis remanei]